MTRIEQIKRANRKIGHAFFQTVDFNGGSVHPRVYGDRFFIVRELGRYRVYWALDDGQILVVGLPVRYLGDARRLARRCVRDLERDWIVPGT